jgi:hypothetical protein
VFVSIGEAFELHVVGKDKVDCCGTLEGEEWLFDSSMAERREGGAEQEAWACSKLALKALNRVGVTEVRF